MSKCGKNYRTVGGRCVRKRYNPFKMIGSYAGALVGLIWAIIDGIPSDTLGGIINQLGNLGVVLILDYGILIILGFLLGWIIHSIFRKLRK